MDFHDKVCRAYTVLARSKSKTVLRKKFSVSWQKDISLDGVGIKGSSFMNHELIS